MLQFRLLLFSIAAATLPYSNSIATTIDANNHPNGGGFNAILDQQSNLLWMDLTHTVGISYQNVITQTLTGGSTKDGGLRQIAKLFRW